MPLVIRYCFCSGSQWTSPQWCLCPSTALSVKFSLILSTFQSKSFFKLKALLHQVLIYIYMVVLLFFIFFWVGWRCISLDLCWSEPSLVLHLSWWIIVGAQFAYIVASERCNYTWVWFTWQAVSDLWGYALLRDLVFN